jgi:phosphoglycerate kinase
VLEEGLAALKHFDSGDKPCVFVLGGAKLKDSLAMIRELFGKQKVDVVCAGGLLGELFLKAKGVVLGAKDSFFEEKGLNGLVEPAKELLSFYGEKIVLPVDVAIMDDSDEREDVSASELPKDNLICDIGPETVSDFKEALKGAKLIVANGPMGMFEKMDFETGTKRVFSAISRSRAFSIVGGGDTETALEQCDFSEKDFSHVSLAGKAMLQYLSGGEMPGLAALKK